MLLQALGVAIALLVLIWAGHAVFATMRRERARWLMLQRELARAEEAARVERRLHRRRIEQAEGAWVGYRKFVVARKEFEDRKGTVCSLYLTPHDGRPLPPFLPGQFVTVRVTNTEDRGGRPAVRCYSLSDRPLAEYYRLTVKRVSSSGGAPGLVSGYLHDRLRQGDLLDIEAPRGNFVLDVHQERPIALVAAGVGLTPLLGMINSVVAERSPRDVWLFYGVRNRDEQIFQEHLDAVAGEHENVRVHVCYSDDPGPFPPSAVRFHAAPVSMSLLKEFLPSNNLEFFVCGPPAMMAVLCQGLQAWGVPESDIRMEAFGAASVKQAARVSREISVSEVVNGATITFARSGKTCRWSDDSLVLLDLAERHGVVIDAGCRAGNCRSCVTAVKSGAVRYLRPPGVAPDAGTCLPCVAVPAGDLVLEA